MAERDLKGEMPFYLAPQHSMAIHTLFPKDQ